jgi:hypothetical protein
MSAAERQLLNRCVADLRMLPLGQPAAVVVQNELASDDTTSTR